MNVTKQTTWFQQHYQFKAVWRNLLLTDGSDRRQAGPQEEHSLQQGGSSDHLQGKRLEDAHRRWPAANLSTRDTVVSTSLRPDLLHDTEICWHQTHFHGRKQRRRCTNARHYIRLHHRTDLKQLWIQGKTLRQTVGSGSQQLKEAAGGSGLRGATRVGLQKRNTRKTGWGRRWRVPTW